MRYRPPSLSTNEEGSIAPPAPSGHTRGAATAWNGPAGDAAVAAPMHCLPLAACCATKYRTKPLPTPVTSGAHVRPALAHEGSTGSASGSASHDNRSRERAAWTLMPAVFVAN